MAILIQNGHLHAFEYGWRFFLTAFQAMEDMRERDIIDRSISHRASKMGEKDYIKFAKIKPKSNDEIFKKHKAGEL